MGKIGGLFLVKSGQEFFHKLDLMPKNIFEK